MATIRGSIEVKIGSGPNPPSPGVTVRAVTVEDVPVVVGALYGFTGITTATPQERAGQVPVAEWTAQTSDYQPVRVILWSSE